MALLDNLVASWSFDNLWTDDTANGNDINNTGAIFGPGKIGEAGVYDGIADGGIVTDSPTVNLPNDFSIMFWFKTSVKDDIRYITAKRGSAATTKTHNWQVSVDTSGLVRFLIWDGTFIPEALGTTDISDGNWHQGIFIRDTVTGELVLIIDKIVEAKETDTTTGSIVNDLDVGVGRRNLSTLNRWQGSLDIGALWSRQLDYGDVAVGQEATGEVARLWNNGIGVQYPFISQEPPTAPDTFSFFRMFQHLLPKAKAWKLTATKQLREFFEGLTGIGTDFKTFLDDIWLDLFPTTTRELTMWEKQFGLPDTLTIEQDRIDRLVSTWRAQGGQSPKYIQDILQASGFPVYVHEFWELPRTVPPTVRNPLTYLNDGVSPVKYVVNCGAQEANCGNAEAVCGASIDPTGYVLVNKIFQALFGMVCGAQEANCGNAEAVCGSKTSEYAPKPYAIPTDSTKWPYFLYIGGQTFPDHATIPSSRRNEFETLCLKICPAQQWLGMLIDYT